MSLRHCKYILHTNSDHYNTSKCIFVSHNVFQFCHKFRPHMSHHQATFNLWGDHYTVHLSIVLPFMSLFSCHISYLDYCRCISLRPSQFCMSFFLYMCVWCGLQVITVALWTVYLDNKNDISMQQDAEI
jgi:hypothetical protein